MKVIKKIKKAASSISEYNRKREAKTEERLRKRIELLKLKGEYEAQKTRVAMSKAKRQAALRQTLTPEQRAARMQSLNALGNMFGFSPIATIPTTQRRTTKKRKKKPQLSEREKTLLKLLRG